MPYIGKKPADIIATAVDTTTGTFSGDIDVDGTTNLDVVDIDGTLNVAGETTLQTHLNMGDGDIIKLGASADLQISHTGSYSLISDSGTGNLILACQDFSLTNPAIGENMITAGVDGAVTLYHDNNAKLATTSTGIGVTGTVTSTGTSVFASLDISGDIDVDGTTNLDVVDIDGAVDMASTLLVAGNVTMQGATTNIGSGAGGTNFELNLNGVASKATRIQFREGVTNRWLLGQGAASETSDFELFNAVGVIALKVDRSTNLVTIANGLTLTDGNLVVASGHGIDFSAAGGSAGGSSSALLDDYEEGTWTPTIGNFTVNSGTWGATGRYIKIGNSVTVSMFQTGGNVTWSTSQQLGGLPFAPIASLYGAGTWTNSSPNAGGQVFMYNTASTFYFAQGGSSITDLVVTATYILT
jgi:cytoskeletal protein CcmA (bactofilin family)